MEGAALIPACRRVAVGGLDMTTLLQKQLAERSPGGEALTLEEAKAVKEATIRVAASTADFEAIVKGAPLWTPSGPPPDPLCCGSRDVVVTASRVTNDADGKGYYVDVKGYDVDVKGYCAAAGEAEAEARTHTLPDGRTITTGKEPMVCAESLFQPSLVGEDRASAITCLLYTSDAADDTPCVDLG
eukprot:1050582-Prorocentrum_minimum.AAC.8